MKKKHILIIVILILLTALIAAIWLLTRSPEAPKGSLTIVGAGKETVVDPAKASPVDVKGETVNAKGEKKNVDTKGYSLKDVISLSGVKEGDYTSAKITSSDEFSASLTAAEIADSKTAFLVVEKTDSGDSSYKLIVFGDNDSKRQVKNVKRIEVTK